MSRPRGLSGMFVLRGMRSVTRGLLGLLTVVPVVALVLAVLLDRGPTGEVRVSIFPMALLALDPFVWTCARNSLIFAVVVTATSLVAGVGLGWLMARLRFWGQPVLRASSALLLAASPVVLALGLVGIWGAPHPWPWPISAGERETRASAWRHGVGCPCGCSGSGRRFPGPSPSSCCRSPRPSSGSSRPGRTRHGWPAPGDSGPGES